MLSVEAGLVPVFITMTMLSTAFIFFLIAALVRLKGNQMKKERQLLKAIAEERERTMLSISAEIHDNVNQVLSLARMSLKMIGKFAIPEQEKYIGESGRMLDTAMGDLRNISHSLNSGYLKERGLLASLEEEVKWVNISKNIHCTLEIEGAFRSLDRDMELMIIRIAQEAIHNTLRHARASNLVIRLQYQEQSLTMVLKDDGKGFTIDPQSPWKGLGLHSMYERSRIIGGTIAIDSGEGGTAITLTVPARG
ncbi:sensor histidine kinase [Taibaiella helva]|uniref:sensor histidine kinase n=1 Tax=Taibaiella helva TaxID=2301235 RepID=UPI000E570B78|nr:sensor histidine kinase [Taibaiella helva]